jgi:Domain of unknown function (DUF4124)
MEKIIILAVLAVFLVSPLQGATIYKWVDEKGVTNFADDPDKVPPAYRNRVLKEQVEDVQKESPPPRVQEPVQQPEERNTDVYGRGETWWRERVRPLKERLKEATENYQNAHQKFIKKAEEISQTNFYGRSRSQTKWDAMELNRLREEEKKHEVQVAEVNERLSALAREAEEAKANPEWVN